MDVNRVIFDKIHGNSSFGYVHRIQFFIHFSIMPFYNSAIDGIRYFYVSRCRCKFPVSVIVQTVAFNHPIIVFDVRFIQEMSQIFFGIIKSFFGVYIIGFTGNCGWSKKIRMPGITEIIQVI